jgi:lysyl-tRNA synthetase class 2
MVETMTAYENYEYNMNLVEEMFRHVAVTAFGKTQFNVKGHVVDFALPWRRLSMPDAVKEVTGVDFREIKSVEEANAKLAAMNVHEAQPSVGEAMVRAFETHVEHTLIQPTLIFGQPIEISPLAKPLASDPRFVERFEIFIAGMECGDNWSEQNDPISLLETWRRSYRAEEAESGKFHTLDFDFIEMLEYGIPPTTGIGPGLERMAMIFTEQENIDDVIFFPLMRPSVSTFNAAVYGIKEATAATSADLALTFADFETLCANGGLKPASDHLTLKAHVRLWPDGENRVTAQMEIDGFVPNGVLRLAGYKLELPSPAGADDVERSPERMEQSVAVFLRGKFPGCKITGATIVGG